MCRRCCSRGGRHRPGGRGASCGPCWTWKTRSGGLARSGYRLAVLSKRKTAHPGQSGVGGSVAASTQPRATEFLPPKPSWLSEPSPGASAARPNVPVPAHVDASLDRSTAVPAFIAKIEQSNNRAVRRGYPAELWDPGAAARGASQPPSDTKRAKARKDRKATAAAPRFPSTPEELEAGPPPDGYRLPIICRWCRRPFMSTLYANPDAVLWMRVRDPNPDECPHCRKLNPIDTEWDLVRQTMSGVSDLSPRDLELHKEVLSSVAYRVTQQTEPPNRSRNSPAGSSGFLPSSSVTAMGALNSPLG